MQKINFTKMVASGNDFVVVEGRQITRPPSPKLLAKKICDRKYGVGADGLLVLEKSKIADIKMRIFNPDGSEAQMCGNGARSVALYFGKKNVRIETKAGVIESQINKENVKIKLTQIKGIKLNIPIKINKRILRINFINTGVPHAVIFVEGLDKIDVFNLGRQIRYHLKFMPAGTNVDFVEVLDDDSIRIRTYERGVEDETLACGTGTAASALLYAIRYMLYTVRRVNVQAKSGEILKVYFERINNKFKDVWLEGKVRKVYAGVYYV